MHQEQDCLLLNIKQEEVAMRWKTDSVKSGDRRVIRYFALLPTELNDEHTVWLERYYALEVWDDGTTSTGFGYWKTKLTSVQHFDNPKTGTPTR
jgi:hypothetical protein